jgi:biopolymer transport protein ExbD
MQFHVRKRRGAPAVIIVALIDVLIVMLIFLMVTTTFKQQPALKLSLPESSQAQKEGASETAPLVITIDAKGLLRLSKANDFIPVTEERLREELRAAVARNPDQKLALNADKSAPFGQVIRVMDAAKAANIKMVSAFAKEAGQP